MKSRIPLLNNRVNYRKEEDSWIIMTPAGKMLSANSTLILLLKACDGKTEIRDLVSQLAKLFGTVASEAFHEQIESALIDLEITRCIEIVEEFPRPSVKLMGPTGLIDIRGVDPNIFDKKLSADPPCQN